MFFGRHLVGIERLRWLIGGVAPRVTVSQGAFEELDR